MQQSSRSSGTVAREEELEIGWWTANLKRSREIRLNGCFFVLSFFLSMCQPAKQPTSQPTSRQQKRILQLYSWVGKVSGISLIGIGILLWTRARLRSFYSSSPTPSVNPFNRVYDDQHQLLIFSSTSFIIVATTEGIWCSPVSRPLICYCIDSSNRSNRDQNRLENKSRRIALHRLPRCSAIWKLHQQFLCTNIERGQRLIVCLPATYLVGSTNITQSPWSARRTKTHLVNGGGREIITKTGHFNYLHQTSIERVN